MRHGPGTKRKAQAGWQWVARIARKPTASPSHDSVDVVIVSEIPNTVAYNERRKFSYTTWECVMQRDFIKM